ncbi:MAG: lysine 2,3-aminomutase, partial [Thermodesulfobacteriota bacterium]|nr:lysine 2,3-aminomutase [Thermodesulfobacteriota bacterium]
MSIYSNTQQKIAEKISTNDDALSSKWTDWHWQLKHSVTRVETFEELLDIQLEPQERRKVELTLKKFPLSMTPYYLSLIDRNDFRNDPIFRQAFPDSRELVIDKVDMSDPLAEDRDSPVPGITHRYPDRVLFHISNVCAMYCRHCTRKRKVGDIDSIPDRNQVREGLDYIRNTPE